MDPPLIKICVFHAWDLSKRSFISSTTRLKEKQQINLISLKQLPLNLNLLFEYQKVKQRRKEKGKYHSQVEKTEIYFILIYEKKESHDRGFGGFVPFVKGKKDSQYFIDADALKKIMSS